MAAKRKSASRHRIHRDFRLPILVRRFVPNRRLYWVLLAVGMIVGRVALLPLLPIPDPSIQDEFSYLLAADTFAHGHAANPAPAHPEFFEAMHVLLNPVYASKYPPGQGFLLAIGQKLFGNPYWGVVLEGSLLIYLFCWMADAWLPAQWALIGGALSAILFFVRHYWFETYWGGSLAACGGALVVGSLGHILRGRPGGARVTLALGAAVLFFTRPFEGGVLCLASCVVLAVHVWRSAPQTRTEFLRVVVPWSTAILIAAATLGGWYNYRVTGSVTSLPYQLYHQQNDPEPLFWIFSPPAAKHYDYAILDNQHGWEWDTYQRLRLLPRWKALSTQFLLFLLTGLWQQFLAFAFLLFALPWARLKEKRALLLLMGAGVAALSVETFSMGHYSAPYTGVILLLILGSARALWYRLAAAPRGGLLFAPIACVLFVFVIFDYQRAFMTPQGTDRGRFVRQLEQQGGRHLVFVDYANGWVGWSPSAEWIYNNAEIENSRIVFAHFRSDTENRELMKQYPGRAAWLVRLGPKPTDVHTLRYDSPLTAQMRSGR